MSPDGRYGSVTAFDLGHSYAELGAFSTRATLIDLENGRSLGNLEDFAVTRNGRALRLARLQLLGRHVRARQQPLLRDAAHAAGRSTSWPATSARGGCASSQESVECPSLSPDETRIAFKKRSPIGWRLHVLDLATGRETRLSERRSVDDQVEWLDDATILYGLANDIWRVRADGTGRPRLYLADARSPAVVR